VLIAIFLRLKKPAIKGRKREKGMSEYNSAINVFFPYSNNSNYKIKIMLNFRAGLYIFAEIYTLI
jgi:hypothetical protein